MRDTRRREIPRGKKNIINKGKNWSVELLQVLLYIAVNRQRDFCREASIRRNEAINRIINKDTKYAKHDVIIHIFIYS